MERLHALAGRSTGPKARRNVEVQDATPVVGHDEENVEDAERRRWNHEEVDRDDVLDVVVQERTPTLGRRTASRWPVPPDRGVAYFDPDLAQFGLDTRLAPGKVRAHMLRINSCTSPSIIGPGHLWADSSSANRL